MGYAKRDQQTPSNTTFHSSLISLIKERKTIQGWVRLLLWLVAQLNGIKQAVRMESIKLME